MHDEQMIGFENMFSIFFISSYGNRNPLIISEMGDIWIILLLI